MRRAPSRLRPSRIRPVASGEGWDETVGSSWWLDRADRASVIGGLRAIRRLLGLLVLTVTSMAVQSVLLCLRGSGKVRFARLYWSLFCRVLGMRVRVIGAPASARNGRQVLFISNHSSWLDIPVLGGVLPGCFVSKTEVGRWPLIGTVARLGRTVFISRRAGPMAREIDAMRAVMRRGDNLILFPEGTTSDGSRVMRFRASFFALASGEEPPIVQPVSVVYDRLAFLPANRMTRPLFAWYGDMDIASHYWRIAQYRGLRATVLLHEPIDPREQPNRKTLSREVWRIVADGAATLRQNRPAAPIGPARAHGESASADQRAAPA
ncbi:MAG TPA: lysophospholipid acyltransferase family protein [Acetobacteraceae bacterium]|nr:lysophospholipid acyltransferase family protein [Acetobacteraceae bacterium]